MEKVFDVPFTDQVILTQDQLALYTGGYQIVTSSKQILPQQTITQIVEPKNLKNVAIAAQSNNVEIKNIQQYALVDECRLVPIVQQNIRREVVQLNTAIQLVPNQESDKSSSNETQTDFQPEASQSGLFPSNIPQQTSVNNTERQPIPEISTVVSMQTDSSLVKTGTNNTTTLVPGGEIRFLRVEPFNFPFSRDRDGNEYILLRTPLIEKLVTVPNYANITKEKYLRTIGSAGLENRSCFILRKEDPTAKKMEEVDVELDTIINVSNAQSQICNYCGFRFRDSNLCQQCRRPYNEPIDVSEDGSSSPERIPSSPSSDVVAVSPPVSTKKRSHKKKKDHNIDRTPSALNAHDTIDLTIDLEDEDQEKEIIVDEKEEKKRSVFDKEPIIEPDSDDGASDSEIGKMRGGGIEVEALLDAPDLENIRLDCRTVRFGSYKVVPEDKILLTEHGLKLKVPSLLKNNTSIIKILTQDIVKVLIHFGQSPVIFLYVTFAVSRKIRELLHMNSKNKNIYYDPMSSDELHKRITLLPERISEEERLFIKSILETRSLMEELTWSEANEILVRAAPKDVQHVLKENSTAVKKDSQMNPSSQGSGGPIKIMYYPPPPAKNGLSINTEDYACLKEDQFLNDVIIDFYLKYFYVNALSEEDRQRTYILSSFFYKRLTTPPSHISKEDERLPPAEKRHKRVKSWTKGVDIFQKDFIIIPINERSHWFLGIICFPDLTGPVKMSDNTPVPNVVRKKRGQAVPTRIWGTSITVVSSSNSGSSSKQESSRPSTKAADTISLIEDPDEVNLSDRDEAEADDSDMEPDTSDDEITPHDDELLDEATPRISNKATKPSQEPVKQPCILIFDSLAGPSRSRVCATLREWLAIEWKTRHRGKSRDFSKDIFKGAVPRVPQQTNYIDCGVYVLQYFEAFFKSPIRDYRFPIRSIKDWFQTEVCNRKRYDIQQILHKLMKEQNISPEKVNLPFIDLESTLYRTFSDRMEGEDGLGEDEVEPEFEDDVMDFEDAEEEEEIPLEDEEEEEEENYRQPATSRIEVSSARFESPHLLERQGVDRQRVPDVARPPSTSSGSSRGEVSSSGRAAIERVEKTNVDRVVDRMLPASVEKIPVLPATVEKIPVLPASVEKISVLPMAVEKIAALPVSVEKIPVSSVGAGVEVARVRGAGDGRSVEMRPVKEQPPPSPRSYPRLPDQVTICEANSKRKLPLSLKDIRNPRLSAQDKAKKMKCE